MLFMVCVYVRLDVGVETSRAYCRVFDGLSTSAWCLVLWLVQLRSKLNL